MMEAMGHVGELFLLTGGRTLRTKSGRDLAQTAYEEMRARLDEAVRLRGLVEQLSGEVDGLRSQNEQLTAMVGKGGE